MRNHMDNRCPAMLEGPWRKARGKTYMKFLKKYYGKDVRPPPPAFLLPPPPPPVRADRPARHVC